MVDCIYHIALKLLAFVCHYMYVGHVGKDVIPYCYMTNKIPPLIG